MSRLKDSYMGCMSCGGKKMKSGGKWIQKAIKHPGSFTKQAQAAGMSVAGFRNKVLANKSAYSSTTVRRANLAKTLAGMRKGEEGMEVSRRDLKQGRKDVAGMSPMGINRPSTLGVPTAPNTIESPANWYNESTWDKAMAENNARPVANTVATPVQSTIAKGGSPKVKAYQEMLRSKGYNIAADGAWGPETQKAYEAYIKSRTTAVNSAPKSTVVRPATKPASKPVAKSVSPYSNAKTTAGKAAVPMPKINFPKQTPITIGKYVDLG